MTSLSPGAGTITVRWKPTGARLYGVRYRVQNRGQWKGIFQTQDSAITLTDIRPEDYEVSIKAYYGNGKENQSAWSAWAPIKVTLSPPPPTPTPTPRPLSPRPCKYYAEDLEIVSTNHRMILWQRLAYYSGNQLRVAFTNPEAPWEYGFRALLGVAGSSSVRVMVTSVGTWKVYHSGTLIASGTLPNLKTEPGEVNVLWFFSSATHYRVPKNRTWGKLYLHVNWQRVDEVNELDWSDILNPWERHHYGVTASRTTKFAQCLSPTT